MISISSSQFSSLNMHAILPSNPQRPRIKFPGGYGSTHNMLRRTNITIQLRPREMNLKARSCTINGDESLRGTAVEDEEATARVITGEYYERVQDMISRPDGGPPRWFSPIESGGEAVGRLDNSPLLLYLPGIDGVGLGLMRQHRKLGKMFDLWCLHIPVKDRTPFTGLVKLVEATVRSEYDRFPSRPIYLVGESLGGCLALVVAAHNPNIDLLLILANPGDLRSMCTDAREKRSLWPKATKSISKGILEMSPIVNVLTDILPKGNFLWKKELLRSASVSANSKLHAIEAEILILSSGRDPFFPSRADGERLHQLLTKSQIRIFDNCGHFLFLEDGVDISYTLKGMSFYRRQRLHNYITDYVALSPSEHKRTFGSLRPIYEALCPVHLSTLNNGEIVRGLVGYPSEGPVLLVGRHMLVGFDMLPLISEIYNKKGITVRGLAHPVMFEGASIESHFLPDVSIFDPFRHMGAVPVSGKNFFKLLSTKSHALLYPGGAREALHRKGEEHNVFWPDDSEFVRMGAKFGAKIVPFGSVGEDDIFHILADHDDIAKVSLWKKLIEEITSKTPRLRTNSTGEVRKQNLHVPLVAPKLPGRLYYLMGKPIETEGLKEVLADRQAADEFYLRIKTEVERCIAYLRQKREHDPYRNILPRLMYQAIHGPDAEVPTFEI